MTVVGFFMSTLLGLAGVWWRIEGRINSARDRADIVKQELSDHKLHVAETYVTKAGMQEQTAQIMDAIGAVKTAIDNMALRVDRVVENQARPRTSRST
jgi:hypothetical protein